MPLEGEGEKKKGARERERVIMAVHIYSRLKLHKKNFESGVKAEFPSLLVK